MTKKQPKKKPTAGKKGECKDELRRQVEHWKRCTTEWQAQVVELRGELEAVKTKNAGLTADLNTARKQEDQARRVAGDYAKQNVELEHAIGSSVRAHWRPPEGLPPDRYLVQRSNCYVSVSQMPGKPLVPVFQLFVWDRIRRPTAWGWWQVTEHGTAVLIDETDELGNLKHKRNTSPA